MYVAVWRYRVEASDREAFERAYGPAGDWSRLFAREPGYRGTELLRGQEGSYATIDRWEDEAAWKRFQREHGGAYRRLDRSLQGLTAAEERIGAFTVLD